MANTTSTSSVPATTSDACSQPLQNGSTGYYPTKGDINYCYVNQVAVPGSNSSRAMERCCSPNVVQYAGGCHAWCETPERYIAGNPGKSSAAADFQDCIYIDYRHGLPDGTTVDCSLPLVNSAHPSSATGIGSLITLLLTLIMIL